ncbi:MAG: hypothetical protein KKG76_01460 [Euryarchaeota archaeon]|nr:hypothetical protein [Euryarchaeota archaeon]
MDIKIGLPNTDIIDESVYKSKAEHDDVEKIGSCKNRVHGPSIVFVTEENPQYNADQRYLEISSKNATVICIGDTQEIYFFYYKELSAENKCDVFKGDDKRFINDLQRLPEIESLGIKILNFVRKLAPQGQLHYYEGSQIYVEKPRRFCAIKIQPRDRSLAITVKGLPSVFKDTKKIELKEAWRSFSRFKLSEENQLEEAFEVISQSNVKL